MIASATLRVNCVRTFSLGGNETAKVYFAPCLVVLAMIAPAAIHSTIGSLHACPMPTKGRTSHSHNLAGTTTWTSVSKLVGHTPCSMPVRTAIGTTSNLPSTKILQISISLGMFGFNLKFLLMRGLNWKLKFSDSIVIQPTYIRPSGHRCAAPKITTISQRMSNVKC